MTTIRIQSILLSAALFLSFATFAQNRSVAPTFTDKAQETNSLKWNRPHEQRISDTQVLKYPHFEGASYDHSYANLPFFFQRIELPANATGFEVELTNMVFEPEPDRSLIWDLNVIEESPLVSAVTSYEKGMPFGRLAVVPYRKSASGSVERLKSFNFNVTPTYDQQKVTASGSWASNSVLSTGTWYRIGVIASGVYKINHTFLKNLGVDTDNLNTAVIRIYGNGGGMLPFPNAAFRHDDLVENAITVVDVNNNGKFDADDYILFYGEAPTKWNYNTSSQLFTHQINDYSDTTYYFLNTDLGPGKRIATVASVTQPKTHNVTTFDDFALYHPDRFNLLKSGREWYGDHFEAVLNQSFSLSIPNRDQASPAHIKVDAIARTTSPSTMSVHANNQPVFTLSFSHTGTGPYDTFAHPGTSNNGFYNSGSDNINITLNYNPAGSISMAWLNYIEINARRQLKMTGSNQVIFRDKNSVGTGNITEFILQASDPLQTQIWDITNPLMPLKREINFTGSTGTFRVQADSLREYIAFSTHFLTPKAVGPVMNQNLHALSQAEMVIVAPPVFTHEANRLADHHRNFTNLSVHVVAPQQIYNEFSSGAQDISAIRDFMRMFYERAQTPEDKPRFLLLFGDGSIDNKHRIGGNTNFIPTFQSRQSLHPLITYVSDDFFGNLDPPEGILDSNPNEGLDVGVGRLPVKNTGEAKAVVDKILRYSSPLSPADFNFEFSADGFRKGSYGDWRNVVCFLADDGNGVLHVDQADKTSLKVENGYPNYVVDKIYFDAYKQVSTPGGERYPDAKDALSKRMERGALIINYTGHGGVLGWAHERVLEVPDINSWKNIKNLPAFFTATCEFSRFDDPHRTSAGELVLLNQNGGAVAMLSTTRVVFAGENDKLNKAFYDFVFVPEPDGEMPFLGDIFRRTKNFTTGGINDLNFSLLGDPAQKLAYPKFDVVTTKINDQPVSSSPDTIQGLSKVTVEGLVVDKSGQKMSNFTGILYPTVYDKKLLINTLVNDNESQPYTFNLKKNILYKGKASVINGNFTFTFIVPKDISYNFDYGSFSYYAHNGTIDAHGHYSNVVVGGIDTTALADNIGPDVRLYINDEKFIFGGMTDENPLLYALVFDSSGINTTGSSIGHDITGIIDEKTDKAIILNDYYQADLDSYQSGKVRYPFSKLAEGHHTLSIKVWDVHNNSSKAYTEFVVSSSADLALNHVLNYPNPFTTHTTFWFEHNRPNTPLDVQIQVFTVSGKLVKTINQPVYTAGFRSDSIEWDGLDDFGDRIGRGVYIYRLRVRAGDSYADHLEKLVILK